MKRLLIISLAIIFFMPGIIFSEEHSDAITVENADMLYQNAIADARAGRMERSLKTLQSLVNHFPERQDMLGDYAVILGWAGNHFAAIELIDRINLMNAPTHVIVGLANSARHQQRFDLAEALYREALARSPDRVEPQIGLALTLASAGKLDEATAFIERLRVQYPQRIDVLEAVAQIAIMRLDYFAALAAYQTILTQEPAHRGALRGKIHTLSRLGTPQLAIELADQYPGILTANERDAINADRTAHQIRWGAIEADSGRGPTRFAGIDRALVDSESAATRALDPTVELTAIERQLTLDRVIALRDRFRMHDAVTLYEAMAARPEPVPSYTQSAAASAYLYIKQPEHARDLYRAALTTDPDNLDSRIGLFFALAESEEHDAALAEIEAAVTITPQWIDAWSEVTTRENPAYIRVLSARAMAPLFANRVGEAEQRLHELSDRAPYNMETRTDYASSMRARGWPRTAEEELRWILAIVPHYSGALGERAGALLEMRDYRNVKPALNSAQAVAAENGRVVRAARLWEVHNMHELIIDGTFGRSSGGPSGTQDFAIDSWLFSKPFNYNYRAFAHAYNAEAAFENDDGRRHRTGIGLEYRSSLFSATGELAHDLAEGDTGVAATLAYTPDDHWTFRGKADSLANETPLQAIVAGVDAWLASGEVIWRAHESRSAALSYTHMEFSDDNRRDIVQARWTERVTAGPVYKLEVTGGVYASHNSLDNAAYFNPSRDFSPTLEFANEWLQWRRYTRAFRHRLVAHVGNYWQEDFGSGAVYGARYEQEWTADDQLTLRYGIGRNRHPYDGEGTTHDFAYLYLNWRF